MRLLPTALVATALMMLAAYAFYHGQMIGGMAFLAGSGVLFFRFATGDRTAGIGDVQPAMDFIRDPAGSIVDAALDRLPGGGLQPAEAKAGDGPLKRLTAMFGDSDGDAKGDAPAFDADAAIARYMANRPAEAAADPSAHPMPAARGFGRKGL